MFTKRFTISCSEIATRVKEIKTKKAEFDNIFKTDIPKALDLKKELQSSIGQLKEILKPVFRIEGKEFPVFKLEIGGKTVKELEKELIAKNIKISNDAKEILHSSGFVTSPTVEQIDLVRLKVSDLGFPSWATTDEIYAKAQELGLELCPAEVGPYQRLKDTSQPLSEWYSIAMKQISNREGDPFVFSFGRNDVEFYLDCGWAWPGSKWDADSELMFRIPNN